VRVGGLVRACACRARMLPCPARHQQTGLLMHMDPAAS
jgi:hypothetical protein